MARRVDTCWRWGAEWVPDVTRAAARTVREGAWAPAREASEPSISVTVEHAGAQARTRADTGRWIDEGGECWLWRART